MSNEMTMDRSFFERAFWPVAIVLALLLLLLLILGYGPYGSRCASCANVAASSGVAPAPAVVTAAPEPPSPAEPAPAAAEPAAPEASAAVTERAAEAVSESPDAPMPEMARVYFGRDSDALPAGTDQTLRGIVTYLLQVPAARVTVSGFHDRSGDPLYNVDLARRRAVAVRSSLVEAGVEAGRIELVKPLVTDAGGPNWEARRVEVSVVGP